MSDILCVQTISELDITVQKLREEVVQSNQLRKQQLVELGLLREEEKQKMIREQEQEVLYYLFLNWFFWLNPR